MSEKILYQHATLGALMAGLYDGTMSVAQLLTHGDLGIGTLDGLDGEMIILAGQAFQAKSTGELVHLNGSELTPYGAVTHFQKDKEFVIENADYALAKEILLKKMASKNVFSAFKLTGSFAKMHVRVMPKQQHPYPKLVEASRIQPEFTRENIKGSIVGFYTPTLFQGAAAAGFHLHFIDETETFGGHILGFDVLKLQGEVATMESLQQHFPIEDTVFMQRDFDDSNLHAEIEEAEGSK